MREKRFNLASRLIHWAIALTVTFLLLTVFLRLGWMDKDNMGSILRENLAKEGISVSQADAARIGKEIRTPMWQYHILSGYVLIAFYLVRTVITIIQGVTFKNPFSKHTLVKDQFKSWLYIIFYIFFLTSLFTGFMIVNGPKDLKDFIEKIHVKSLYYIITFIIVHIGGVLLADMGSEPGIISKIVSGNKKDK
jgi:cytochrome b561